MTYPRVLVVIGTRPEAIKLAPVHAQFRQRFGALGSRVLLTGQQPEAARDGLNAFGIAADIVLPTVTRDGLGRRMAAMLDQVSEVMFRTRPDHVVVLGGSNSAMAGALAAYYADVPVTHVEAGIRTHNLSRPYPDEGNRQLISRIAALHFAPSAAAAANLQAEGIPGERIEIVGNTIVDAVALARPRFAGICPPRHDGTRRVLVALQRREFWGDPIARFCSTLRQLTVNRPDIELVFALHPDPALKRTIRNAVGKGANIQLVETVDFLSMQALLSTSDVLITDSNGLQEAAPCHRLPTLVARDTTDQIEAIEAGTARLVGFDGPLVVQEVQRLLDDPEAHAAMARPGNPFGDGRAAERIVAAVLQQEAVAA